MGNAFTVVGLIGLIGLLGDLGDGVVEMWRHQRITLYGKSAVGFQLGPKIVEVADRGVRRGAVVVNLGDIVVVEQRLRPIWPRLVERQSLLRRILLTPRSICHPLKWSKEFGVGLCLTDDPCTDEDQDDADGNESEYDGVDRARRGLVTAGQLPRCVCGQGSHRFTAHRERVCHL